MGAPKTDVDICNLALGHLKSAPIAKITGQNLSNPETVCAQWYDVTRRAFLEDNAWNFAIKRARLDRSGAPTFGYEDQYNLPDDFLTLLSIGTFDTLSDHPRLFQLEAGANGERALLVNQSSFSASDGDTTLPIRYVYDHKDITRWPSMVSIAMSYELALNMAFHLRGSNSNIDKLLVMSEKAWQRASANDGKQRPPIRIQRSSWVRRRRLSGRSSSQYIETSGY